MNIQIREYSSKDETILKTTCGKINPKTFAQLIDLRYGRNFDLQMLLNIINTRQKTWLAFLDGKLIGFADLSKVNDDGYSEMGYLIFPEYQKKGFGYEIAKYVIDYSAKHTNKIKAETEITNSASQKLLNRITVAYKPTKIKLNKTYTPNTITYYWDFID